MMFWKMWQWFNGSCQSRFRILNSRERTCPDVSPDEFVDFVVKLSTAEPEINVDIISLRQEKTEAATRGCL